MLNARVGGGGGYSNTLPIRVCAAQRGRDFEAPDLERGIHLRLHLLLKIVADYLMYKSNKLRNIFLKKQDYFNLQTF